MISSILRAFVRAATDGRRDHNVEKAWRAYSSRQSDLWAMEKGRLERENAKLTDSFRDRLQTIVDEAFGSQETLAVGPLLNRLERRLFESRLEFNAERTRAEEARAHLDAIAEALHPHWVGDGHTYIPEQLAPMIARLRSERNEQKALFESWKERLSCFLARFSFADIGDAENCVARIIAERDEQKARADEENRLHREACEHVRLQGHRIVALEKACRDSIAELEGTRFNPSGNMLEWANTIEGRTHARVNEAMILLRAALDAARPKDSHAEEPCSPRTGEDSTGKGMPANRVAPAVENTGQPISRAEFDQLQLAKIGKPLDINWPRCMPLDPEQRTASAVAALAKDLHQLRADVTTLAKIAHSYERPDSGNGKALKPIIQRGEKARGT